MLHRPKLIPDTMKTPCKTFRTLSEMESSICPLINNDEVVIIEPTDPDEDRIREQQQWYQQKQQRLPEQHKPPSTHEVGTNSELSKSKTGNFRTMTDVPKSVTPTTPLTEALQSLLSVAARSLLSTLNGSFSSNVPNKLAPSQDELKSCPVPRGVTEFLLQSSTSAGGSSTPSGPRVTESATGSHNATTAIESLHPLVAALLVNCATVNLITQHVKSLGVPIYISPSLGQNSTLLGLNLPNIYSASPSCSSTESNIVQQPDSTHPRNVSSVDKSTDRTDSAPVVHQNDVLSSQRPITGSTNPPTTPENHRTTSIVQSLLNEAKTAIEVSKFTTSPIARTTNRVKRFKCPVPSCHLAFYSRFNQTEHIRTHTGERPFVCAFSDCTAAFKRRRDLRDHINAHVDCPNATTDDSPMTDLTPCTLNPQSSVAPITAKSNILLGPIAQDCSENTVGQVTREMDKLEADVTFCGPILDDPNPRPEEAVGKSGSMERTAQIKQEYVPRNSSLLEQNISADPPVPKTVGRRHPCPYSNCGKAYAKLNKLKEHLRSHTGERPYVCREPGCGAAFIRLYGVRRHELTHVFGRKGTVRSTPNVNQVKKYGTLLPTSDDSNPDIGEQCCARSSSDISKTPPVSSSSMAKPLLVNVEPSQMCTDSGEIFTTTETGPDSSHSKAGSANLSTRAFPVIAPKAAINQPPRPLSPISGSPGIRRPHACPFRDCGKAFPKLNKLREHICRHTGERPFVCDKCNASFVRMYDLRRHGKIHLRASDPRQDAQRPLAPKRNNPEAVSVVPLKPEPDSTLLC